MDDLAMRIRYDKPPEGVHQGTLETIEQANAIIAEYARQGFTLTLRQLYYQFVARDLIENSDRSYKRLGDTISKGRMWGYISWDAIEDRLRSLRVFPSWMSPKDLLKTSAAQFRLDPWRGQKKVVEVWVEKDALIGVIEAACRMWRNPHFGCRGYVSQSAQWRSGRRALMRWSVSKQATHVLHLGDHDPSGIDMTRDNDDRLQIFGQDEKQMLDETPITVERVALNMPQIEELKPPPNPAKLSDSRAGKYIKRFGSSSWELDALDPNYIRDLIESRTEPHINHKKWNAVLAKEEKGRERMAKIAREYRDE